MPSKLRDIGQDRRRGVVALILAITAPVVLMMIGMATEAALLFVADTHLAASTDAAVLAAARVPPSEANVIMTSVFNANFPAGRFLSTANQLTDVSIGANQISARGTAKMPTFLLRLTGRSSLDLQHTATVTLGGAATPELILIDEDAIDNGAPGGPSVGPSPRARTIEEISGNWPNCGGGQSDVCVNDDIATPNLREILFTRGNDILPFEGLALPTGQTGDEGLFRFGAADPQYGQDTPTQTFTVQEFFNGTGAAADQANLDKISGIEALDAAAVKGLVGKRVCAVVFDADIAYDETNGYGVLQGATTGVTAFEVTGWEPSPDGGSSLPWLTINLLDVDAGTVGPVCDGLTASGGGGTSSASYMNLAR